MIMSIDEFNRWNEKKKLIHLRGKYPPFFNVGDIWWSRIGKNISTEVTGKGINFARPVLIIQRVYKNACIVVPLTSIIRNGNYYHIFKDSKNKTQCALLTQIRYLDGKRLMNRISHVPQETIELLIKKFTLVLDNKKIAPSI
jgi:mRNA-degrading endonuclease toxin of MazEF toxin-antitoxin module